MLIKTPPWIINKIKEKGIGIKSRNEKRNIYKMMLFNGHKIKEHIFIWNIINGEIPKDYMIHHINGIKTDNRIENLECVDRITHGLRHRKII